MHFFIMILTRLAVGPLQWRRGWIVSTPTWFSRDPRFDSEPAGRLSWPRLSPVPPNEFWNITLTQIMTDSFQIIPNSSSQSLSHRRYITYVVVETSLNELINFADLQPHKKVGLLHRISLIKKDCTVAMLIFMQEMASMVWSYRISLISFYLCKLVWEIKSWITLKTDLYNSSSLTVLFWVKLHPVISHVSSCRHGATLRERQRWERIFKWINLHEVWKRKEKKGIDLNVTQ
jgi:hypothetical protein